MSSLHAVASPVAKCIVRPLSARWLLGLVLLVAGGCSFPGTDGAACNSQGLCVAGLVCVDGTCRSPTEPGGGDQDAATGDPDSGESNSDSGSSDAGPRDSGEPPGMARLALDIAIAGAPAIPGDRLLYTITVANISAVSADDVGVSFTVPTGLRFSLIDIVPDDARCGNSDCTPDEVASWMLGALGAGESRTITVNAMVDAGLLDGAVIDLSVTLTGGIEVVEETSSVDVNIGTFPDLALSASADPVVPGDTFSFTVDVGNATPTTLPNAQLTATLPAGLTVDSVSDGGTASGDEVTWTLDSVAAGTSLQRTVTVRATAPLVSGQILHADATLSYDGGPASHAEHVVTVVGDRPPLSVDIATSVDPAEPNSRALYTITLSNTSGDRVDDVSVLLRVPAGLRFAVVDIVPDDARCGNQDCRPNEEAIWQPGTLAAGEALTISINAVVSGEALAGQLIAMPVRVTTSALKDTIDLVDVIRVASSPQAELSLSASTDPVVPGEPFSFKVDVGHIGQTALTNAEVRVMLPPGLTVQNVSDGGTAADNEVTWNLASVAVGASLTREVTVTPASALSSGQILHSDVALTYDGGLAVDHRSEHVVTGQRLQAPLSVDIASSVDPAEPGGRVLYTLTLSNISAQPVSGVSVLLRVPEELSFRVGDIVPNDARCSNGTCSPGEEAIWLPGTLAPGETQTISINAIVDGAFGDGELIATPVRVTATGFGDTIDLLDVIRTARDPQAELALSASSDPVARDETFSFKVDLGHIGDLALTNARVRLVLPAGLTVQSVSDGGTMSGNEVTWSFASIPVSASLTREVTVKADTALVQGQILHADAVLTYDGGLRVDHTAEFVVTGQVSPPAVNMDIGASADPAVPGDRVLYALTISNRSPLAVDDIEVLLRVPEALSFVLEDIDPDDARCGNGSCTPHEEAIWTPGTLGAGESCTISINASVAGAAVAGHLIAMPVRITAEGLRDIIDRRKVVRVAEAPRTNLALSASKDPVVTGETFSFTVHAANVSDSVLTDAELSLTLPAGLTLGTVSDGGASAGNEVTWTIGSVPVGSRLQRSVTLTADGVVPGDIAAIPVELTHAGGAEIDNRSEFAVSVAALAPLTVSVAASPDPASSGSVLAYRMTVENVLARPVNSVTVLFRVPAQLSFRSSAVSPTGATCGNGFCSPHEEAVWALGSLASRQSQVITIDATLAPGLADGTLIRAPVLVTADELTDTIHLQSVAGVAN